MEKSIGRESGGAQVLNVRIRRGKIGRTQMRRRFLPLFHRSAAPGSCALKRLSHADQSLLFRLLGRIGIAARLSAPAL